MKMTDYHITDYHREIGIDYYKKLLNRYGIKNLLRHIPAFKRIIWNRARLTMVENHLGKGG